MYVNTDILFPARAIAGLRNVGGATWRGLVEQVAGLAETDPASLAFSLMMIRMSGCLECETDSYRAMRGCSACALQTVKRTKGQEREMLHEYQQALRDVKHYLAGAARPAA
jgi:hypothetical protein